MKKWKILIFVPYMIMVAIILFYALLFGGLLGFIFAMGVLAIEIPFMILYTIGLGLSSIIRWIIIRKRKKK